MGHMKKRAGIWATVILAILAIATPVAYVTGYFTIGKYEESGYIEGVKAVDRVFPGGWYVKIYKPMRWIEQKLTGKYVILVG